MSLSRNVTRVDRPEPATGGAAAEACGVCGSHDVRVLPSARTRTRLKRAVVLAVWLWTAITLAIPLALSVQGVSTATVLQSVGLASIALGPLMGALFILRYSYARCRDCGRRWVTRAGDGVSRMPAAGAARR